MYMYIHVHVLMRDEKEGRKKQARSNKQQGKATQHTQVSVTCTLYCLSSLSFLKSVGSNSNQGSNTRFY